MSNKAVENLEDHLGLRRDSGYSFNNLLTLANTFRDITGHDEEINAFSLLFYLDKIGDFTKIKSVKDKIVNDIFTNLKPDDITQLIPFLEWYEKGCPEEKEKKDGNKNHINTKKRKLR